jgi:hypothetical protein
MVNSSILEILYLEPRRTYFEKGIKCIDISDVQTLDTVNNSKKSQEQIIGMEGTLAWPAHLSSCSRW